jgi:segregation and condensation protein B
MHSLSIKELVEAILFSIPEPFTAEELAFKTNRRTEDVRKALEDLSADYAARNGVISIEGINGRYAMAIRREAAPSLRKYIREAELTPYELKMLAIISKHNGILKGQMAKAMGSGVYDHIRSLVEKGFVQEVKIGRNTALKTTGKVPEKALQQGQQAKAQTIADFAAEKPAEAGAKAEATAAPGTEAPAAESQPEQPQQ